MSIKPGNFRILFLLLSLGSVIISTLVFFLMAYEIGSDSIKKEAMRTVGVAADGKYNNLSNRLSFQKHLLDNLLTFEMDICGDGAPKQVESCIKNSITQFCKIQKIQSLYFEKSDPKMVLQLGKPSREPVFDPGLKEGQLARFYDGGKPNPYYVMQSESAGKKSRIVVEISINKLDAIFTEWNLGKNGESFMVDPQGFFLTTHKYHVTSGIGHPIDAKPMVMCLGGKSGETVGLDYAGIPIIHGFRYIPEIGGGCIMVHIDQREAFAELDTFTMKWLAAAIILWAVLGVIAWLVSGKLAAQLQRNLDEVEESGRKLRESEMKYRQIFHACKAVCLLIDSETGKLFDVNAAACGYYGYTKDEMLSKTIYDINILAPSEINAAIEEAKTGKLDYFVGRHRLSSGDVRDVESALSPLSIGGQTMIYSIVHDVTERKKVEAALKVAETKFHTLFDESPDGVLLFDTTTAGLVDFNETAHRQLGYTKEEFTLLTVSDFEVLETAADTQKHIAKVLVEGFDIFETKHGTKSGEIRNVQVIAKIMVLEGKTYIHCIFRDITAQKEAERRIRESEANIRAILDNSPVPMAIIDHQRRTVYLNRKFTEAFGYVIADIPSMEELWPALFSDLLSGEETKAEWNRRSKNTLLEGVEFAPMETELVNKHGKHLTVVVNVTFMNGQALVVFHDITGQKEAERRIRESEDLFRNLFENSPVGATLHLAEGPCVMANDAVVAGTDGTREELLRQNFRELESWRESGMLDAAVKALDSGNTVRFEFNQATSFDKNIVIDAQFTPISINGKRHLLSMFNDISHLRDAQEKMRLAKDEAEEANKLKDKFIMLVSHDLKTPLVGILGMMQLLQKQPEIGVENKHMIDLAVQGNKRMIRMIDQLLDINRIRSGKLQLKCHYCNASDIVKKAVETVDLVAAEKGITIQNMVPDTTMVIADPVFLEQVFCNLLTNAIKFSGPGKAITIKFSPGEELVFTIEDNGVGISPDLMQNLFSYQEKTSTRGTQGEIGTGFGLPLSRDIMEALNGKLKAESRPEGGASFSVILPKPAPNLLVMENSPGSCDGLKFLLEKEGFAVTVSPHALRVLEMLEEKRFDFLLVQLSADKDTGSELIHLVTGKEKLKGMPVLTVGESKCYKRINDGGADMVIECGAEISTVIAAIHSMLIDGGQDRKV